MLATVCLYQIASAATQMEPGSFAYCADLWDSLKNNKQKNYDEFAMKAGVFRNKCSQYAEQLGADIDALVEAHKEAKQEAEEEDKSKQLISDDENVTCAELLEDKKISTAFSAVFCPSGSSGSAITVMIGKIADYIVGLIGTIVVIMIIVSGIQMAASAGNPDAITSAKKRLIAALISLALLLSIRVIMALLGVPV